MPTHASDLLELLHAAAAAVQEDLPLRRLRLTSPIPGPQQHRTPPGSTGGDHACPDTKTGAEHQPWERNPSHRPPPSPGVTASGIPSTHSHQDDSEHDQLNQVAATPTRLFEG